MLDWTDDFDTFDTSRWSKGNWTFGGNRVDFDPANAVAQDGTLILAITKEGATGFTGAVPVDPQGNASAAPVPPGTPSIPTTPTTPTTTGSESACSLLASPMPRGKGTWLAGIFLFGLASLCRARRQR